MSKLQYNSQTNKLGELLDDNLDYVLSRHKESYDYAGTRKLEHNQIVDSSELVEQGQCMYNWDKGTWYNVSDKWYEDMKDAKGNQYRTVYLDAKPEQPKSFYCKSKSGGYGNCNTQCDNCMKLIQDRQNQTQLVIANQFINGFNPSTKVAVEPEAVREEDNHDDSKAIDFAVWYSGMNPEKVERAYQRYLSEIKLNQQ